jgi:hypothetical protein
MNRVEVIKKIIEKNKAKTYLEIGVEFGTVFSKIKAKRKIAVDPELKISWKKKIGDLPSIFSARYFNMTSDEFFDQQAVMFAQKKIDVAFVDGLHVYSQSLKDIENCLKHLNEKGIIIVHDCSPKNEFSAASSREISVKAGEKKWNGDVWKAIVCLRSTRSDLTIFILDCDYGLGIIRKGQPENMLDYSLEQIKEMAYKDLAENRAKFLNLKDISYFEKFLNTI